MDLLTVGWNDRLAQAFEPHRAKGLEPGRVVAVHRGWCDVALAGGVDTARVPSRLFHLIGGGPGIPAVGDWIGVHPRTNSQPYVVAEIMPRETRLCRRQPGRKTSEQVIAANITRVAIVMALSEDYNLNRLERYLVVAHESGAQPVVILTKSDLCDDVKDATLDVQINAGESVPVIAISVPKRKGLLKLKKIFAKGETVALVGSSGAGKSTLLNHLYGEELMATQEVRENDGKGRHTTSHRQLVVLPGGCLLIDNPGVREVGAWEGEEEAVADTFEDIYTLAHSCKFRDCKHESEPGCAVQAAIEEGDLTLSRLDNFRALQGESVAVRKNRAEAQRIQLRQHLRKRRR
jgi:ribosome biogenesis GTPase